MFLRVVLLYLYLVVEISLFPQIRITEIIKLISGTANKDGDGKTFHTTSAMN